jgi:transcription elongation factor B polypeptide 3
MQVIKDNIGDLGYTGGIPYDILKPALERANPQQLMNIESQNDHLIGETDELWQFHCRRDFRGTCPVETESWRELYERCKDGQQQRFEQIKKKMKLDRMKKETAEPQRKTKLAFIDTTGGPRFHKEKAQTIKNGMKTLKIKEEKGVKTGATSSASVGFNNPKVSGDPTKVIVQEASVIIAPGSRSGHAPAPSVSRDRGESVAKVKPKKAPLMQKTMKLIRSLNRR